MADTSNSRISITQLIFVPSLITLAVTLLRLVGELQNWPSVLFSREAGGGLAIIGITWLALVFGVYFALKRTISRPLPLLSSLPPQSQKSCADAGWLWAARPASIAQTAKRARPRMRLTIALPLFRRRSSLLRTPSSCDSSVAVSR